MVRQPPANNDNADWGRTAETAACEHWPLERVSGDTDEPWWFDARATESIIDTDGFGDVEVGTPIEVKSALWRIDANGGDRRGRWLLRERAHEQLLEADGEYALAVVRAAESIVGLVLRPAWFVDGLVTSWSPTSTRRSARSGRRVAQIPWGRVFDEGDGKAIANGDITDKGGASS